MLVLERRVQEALIIGGNVRVTFLGVRGSVARFGIEAPHSVTVDREEVHERKKREDREARGNTLTLPQKVTP